MSVSWRQQLHERLEALEPLKTSGKVTKVVGLLVEGWLADSRVGAMCRITSPDARTQVPAEVVGFRSDSALLMPLDQLQGIAPGSSIECLGLQAEAELSPQLRGRVLDGLGRPLDGRPLPPSRVRRPIYAPAPGPLERPVPRKPLYLGVRAIDVCVTLAEGQRLGIVAGTGLGKSVLCGQIARFSQADVNVIALIGERGREVSAFIEQNLGQQGLERSVVVAVTGDRSPVERTRGAFLATAIAEYFMEQGLRVMLIMDSLTRVAMAQREIGLAVGEPPTTKGYPPSVLAILPRLVERAGLRAAKGSITALYTVLAEGNDLDDPVVDAARSVLDGHVVLSRELAARGQWPAVDILGSISRLMNDVVDERHRRLAEQLRALLADYQEIKELVQVGAYQRGNNARGDRALALIDRVWDFLKQSEDEFSSLPDSLDRLEALLMGKEQA